MLSEPCPSNHYLCDHIQLLRENLQRHGYDLVKEDLDLHSAAQQVWESQAVVLSHNADSNPLFTYANRKGLELLELDWQQLLAYPSCQSAEVEERAQREDLLHQARKQGLIDNYSGIRVSSSGKRFKVDRVKLWNLFDKGNQYVGQAALIKDWQYID